MKEHFLNYEQSLAVKELGFKEPCISYYNADPYFTEEHPFNMLKPFNHRWCLPAPLKSQFFQWAREKKLSDSCICRYQSRDDGGIYYYYVINHDFGVEETKHYKEGFYSYEQAEDACINKIIELLKLK